MRRGPGRRLKVKKKPSTTKKKTTKSNSDQVRVQILHKPQDQHDPYRPKSVEDALKRIPLPELPWAGPHQRIREEGIIRHETGAEIIVLATTLIGLASSIIALYKTCKKSRPETSIRVTVRSAKELERVLRVLEKQG